jgi:DNA-binding LacI/PurR family transcriptional regulator
MPKRPTQSDVARVARVSRGTVSRVLSNQPNGRIPISDETRVRVFQAAQTLGYAPNPVAQMLVRGHHHLVGIFSYERVFPYRSDNFFFPYLSGIQVEAGQQGYNVLLFTEAHQYEEISVYRNSMNSLYLADGSILLGTRPDHEELRRLTQENYPFIYIGRREVTGAEISWVANDYATATGEATLHLLELNHKRIGFLGQGLDVEAQQDKLRGAQQAVESTDANLVILPEWETLSESELVQLLRQQGLTALLCSAQNVFCSTLDILHGASIQVPQAVSLVCLTNCDPCSSLHVEPTYVDMNQPEVGKVAMRRLIMKLNGALTEPRHVYLPCRFVVGHTTGLARILPIE